MLGAALTGEAHGGEPPGSPIAQPGGPSINVPRCRLSPTGPRARQPGQNSAREGSPFGPYP